MSLRVAATDLSRFLSCRHCTALDMAVARGKRERPYRHDPLLRILAERGEKHERSYVEALRARGQVVVDLSDIEDFEQRMQSTLEAMRAGADAVVQGALRDGPWFGYPDVLQRVERASSLGGWSYEVADTKLARETRGGTILQLSLYSDMLATAQRSAPEFFHVITPDVVQPIRDYRVADYAAYSRLIRARLRAVVGQDDEQLAAANYPEPVEYCDVCHWLAACDTKRRHDDHLSLVAGITQLQRRELAARSVTTVAGVARLPVPLPFTPTRGSSEALERVRHQARLQLDSRAQAVPLHELRAIEDFKGLLRLPEPSLGDVFLDLEGDPLAIEGGRDYLFGVVTLGEDGPRYRAYWGLADLDERRAFEALMDFLTEQWQAHQAMHVYHYAPYEPTALKRLMGRYATREAELDRLLRAERFVDLYSVVRQSMLVGVERYSIKNLEPLYAFARAVPLHQANRALHVIQEALELGRTGDLPDEVRLAVEGYNRDDCLSTHHLRDWLEGRRAAVEARGTVIKRPLQQMGDAPEAVDEQAQRVAALRARLLADVPELPNERSAEQHARWVLAYLLDWHRREDKAAWWEYFRLRDLPEEELMDEPQAVAGLEYVERVKVVLSKKGRPTGSVIDRYRFAPQEMELGREEDLRLTDGSTLGKLVAVDRVRRTIDIRKGPSRAAEHPSAVFAYTYVATGVLEDAIYCVAESVANDVRLDLDSNPRFRAARDLLLARGPRLGSGVFVPEPNESMVDFAIRVAGDLAETVLAIQGPPGAGKTHCGARMICALVAQGKKVAVTASSHKVIAHLLAGVATEASRQSLPVALAHKTDDGDSAGDGRIRIVDDNTEALAVLQSGEVQVLGGTAWLWARPEFAGSVDVVFVDEAGQMSLTNVIALSTAARSVVLLGDPQQLEQPTRGSHPEGVNVSALQRMLDVHLTMPSDRGIFLPVTWRLSPNIAAFTSEVFYEQRLHSKEGLERQTLSGTGEFDGSGLWVVEVEHDGNRSSADEEVAAVHAIVRRLTAPGATWIDERGQARALTGKDILVIAPFNAQVSRLSERLEPLGVRVGTVDRFQGQEGAVVIYSMATSRPEDAPRGMEFLYSLNRLNVATSRARCAVILVASARLFEPECRTPRQMKLANALCRFREMSRSVRL